MIYLTLNGSAPFNVGTHSVRCTNRSDDWKDAIVLYHGERPTKDIHVSAVCRYVIYVPPTLNGISEVDLCEIEIGGCPLRKYGVNCEMNCSENCILGFCNLVNGNCTHGCVDGWFGERCNEPCKEGHFGKQCIHACSQHCSLPHCDHVTGKCNGGCKKGWKDTNCFTECSPGYFGRNCSQSCDGCLSKTCDRFDGFCHVGDKCKPGYINYPKCNQSCANWFYGENCANKCNCLSEPCNKSTGMCPGGKCDRGWSGESCNKECSDGYFGYNCIGYCNNCLNTSCEMYEGNCTYGSKQAEFQSIEEPGPVTLIIGGICAAIFMVILAIILFIVYRRFSRSQKHRNHPNMEENKKTRSALTDQSAMYENVTGDFASSENIQLSFEEKHDRKIRTLDISSYDLPDEEEEGNVNVYGNVISEDDICQHKIQIEDLSYVINEKRKDHGFEKEYGMFPKGLIHAHVEGSKEENKAKNRFLTTWPYDHSRVVLKGDTPYDYINANYIDSYYKEKAYIATQGPKRNTVRDFWHMIWQENVGKIVMVTQLEEEGKKKCDQYWPQTTNKPLVVGNFVLNMEVEKEHSVYMYRLINVKHKLEKQERRVHHFHFIQWPDHGVPDSIKLVNFYRAVTNIRCDQPGPLLVHCSAGIGRTGTFIAIDSLYEHGKSVGYFDVKEYVQIMRKDRMNMIQTFEQYEAVFETLQELFTVPDTSIHVNDFCSYVQEQENTKVPQNQKTYRLEFQRLQSLRPSYSLEHFTSSRLEENISKNAVNSILPHDDFRPYLMSFGKNKNNYINAVLIPGYSPHGSFLVTHCPLKETVVDFWTMVYDHDSSIVVLLDTLNEDAPLWSKTEKLLEFEKFDIELDNDQTPREVQLSIVHRANKQDKRSIHVFSAKECKSGNSFLPTTADMLVLLQRVIDQRKHQTGPVTVVCSNGATTSGLFVALSFILEKMKIDDQVDVFQVIRTIQLRRPEFVTNFDQYEYCYKCIKDLLEGQSVYANL
ncbi:receptor-type tyrosine-protein phosphatase epsilon-like [Mytilus edulis]|uniref:receptor-type tyrosine-protein phosphatase epsilon-like n=1 Tax=Mytilus edulis TaxID=6550 RepID=UPI0039EECC1C